MNGSKPLSMALLAGVLLVSSGGLLLERERAGRGIRIAVWALAFVEAVALAVAIADAGGHVRAVLAGVLFLCAAANAVLWLVVTFGSRAAGSRD